MISNILRRSRGAKLIQPQSRAFTTAKLREFWNDFSDDYVKETEHYTVPVGLDLYALTSAHFSGSVVETGAGSGTASSIFATYMQKEKSHFVTCDLSDTMVEKMEKRYPSLASNYDSINYSKLTREEAQDMDFTDCDTNSKNIYSLRSSNEDLPFKDNQFDAYVSTFCLNIVNDPVKMLTEAHRILKPHGKIGVSLWGRRSESPFFVLLPKILKKNGAEFPEQKSYFHMEGKVCEFMKTAGFKDIKNVQRLIYINQDSTKVLRSLISSPFYRKVAMINPEEVMNASIEEFLSTFDEMFTKKNKMIHFEADICVATK
ncbi:unnamed protein product [Moneuplotes crassus]|uniref:Methyltransferase type 11 domain-containing protein n=1 Tax=Euplotes crassus TaxID=5936 RepID=A0AAD1XP97_EUPCR|nr:unnamed protein product [Moneuplotes crassus]